MTASRKRLGVLEPSPVLATFLAEQIDSWDVTSLTSMTGFDLSTTLNALVLTDCGDPRSLAEEARRQGLIGPIFSVAEQGPADLPGPFIWLSKPLRLSELSARLEDPNGAAIDGVMLGKWRIDSSQRQLLDSVSGHVERLTDKEFEVLLALLMAQPEPLSREQLQAAIWRYHSETMSHTVETHIWRLRQKIETDPAQPELVKTAAEGYIITRH